MNVEKFVRVPKKLDASVIPIFYATVTGGIEDKTSVNAGMKAAKNGLQMLKFKILREYQEVSK